MAKKLKATNNLAKDTTTKTGAIKQPVQLDKMSVTELQALGYRIIGLLEKNQADLRMINDQIAKKT